MFESDTMNVSPDFSPPMRIMAPYFLLGGLFYLLSMLSLLFLDIDAALDSFEIAGWVHLYLLGFVMMFIFGAMAQLGPVVVETKHAIIDLFRIIWILLLIGVLLMVYGFYVSVAVLPYGGIFVLIAMTIFAVELHLTLRQGKRKTSVTLSMKTSNFFLLLGLLNGILMALGLAGVIDTNTGLWFEAHIFGLLGGFVMLTIMGISIVLIPMFGLAKRISDNEFAGSLYTMSAAVVLMLLASPLELGWMRDLALGLLMSSLLLYMYQVYKMTRSRVKVIHDIWAKSMYVGYISLGLSWSFGLLYLFGAGEQFLLISIWLLLVGFIGFVIMGNLYKIIPFLIWFQYYSPYIGERDVPMLHEMIPQRLADMQLVYSTLGLVVTTVALGFGNQQLFAAGSAFLVTGAAMLFIAIRKMMGIRE